jgi:hypothetical protein
MDLRGADMQILEWQDRYKAVCKENDRFHKLFWLAARDALFFATWNEKSQQWDDGWHPTLNCNDFFAPAADAEGIPDENLDHHLDLLIELTKKFDHYGPLAWIALRRGQEPWKGAEKYPGYIEAKKWLTERGGWNE